MNKLIYLLAILLAVPFVYAEDKIIETNLYMYMDSWIDGITNESRANITIYTESQRETKNWVLTNRKTVSNETFLIGLLRSLDCNSTETRTLTDECKDKMINCSEQISSLPQYITCIDAKARLEVNKQNCDEELGNCTIKAIAFDEFNPKYLELQANYNNLDYNSNRTEDRLYKEKVQAENSKIVFGMIGLGLGLIIMYAIKKPKYPMSRGEKELGKPNLSNPDQESDWKNRAKQIKDAFTGAKKE